MKSKRLDVFKSWLLQGAEFVGNYELPKLKPCYAKPDKAIPFDKSRKTTDRNQWIHFYIDDFRFEIMWNDPKKYLPILKTYCGVISTDFSLYREMPLSMQIWNTYRNRAISFWLQRNGVEVVPNIRWGDERTYDFCFDGICKNSSVAISTNGCIRDKTDREYFKCGLAEMIRRLEPKTIVNYSCMPDDIFLPYKNAGFEIISILNWNDTVRKKVSD